MMAEKASHRRLRSQKACACALLLFLLAANTSLAGAAAPGVEWARTFDRVVIHSVREAADGGYVATGRIQPEGRTDTDVFIVKLDARGDLDPSWRANPLTFGVEPSDKANGNDDGWSVRATTDGGCIVAGGTCPFEWDAGSCEVYVIKLDSKGALDASWPVNPQTFGGPRRDCAFSVRQTTDGGYVVAGEFEQRSAGMMDAYMIKLDARGELDPAWPSNPTTFGGDENDSAYAIRQTPDGGYVVMGKGGSFAPRTRNWFLLTLDRKGALNATWPENPRVSAAFPVTGQVTSDGGFIFAGTDPTDTVSPRRILLVKTDGQLNEQWSRTYGEAEFGDPFLMGECIQQVRDGGYVVALGNTFRTDELGNLLWETSAASGFAVEPAADGGYIVVGWNGITKLGPDSPAFLRGRADGDDVLNLADAICLLIYLFLPTESPCKAAVPNCLDAADADDDGKLGMTDPIVILMHLFAGAGPLPDPFGACGVDATADELGCISFKPCSM
jgi:hypothetical protein